eukprot:8160569-Heterocapsa_arctica.AAC.1
MQPAHDDDEEDSGDDNASTSNDRRNLDPTIPKHMTEVAVNYSWSVDHSVYLPRWEEAPGANPDEAD